MIFEYFTQVRDKLEELSWIILEQSINFDLISKSMGIIEGTLVFIDNSTLDFMELVSEEKREYRFNYLDKDKNLIYRWDSAPHHKGVSSFPFHLHTKRKIEESRQMSLIEVLDIIAGEVIDNLEGSGEP